MAYGPHGERRESRQKQQKRRVFLLAAAVLVIVALAAVFYIRSLRKDDYHTEKREIREEESAAGAEEAFADAEDSNLVWYGGKSYTYNDHLSNFLLMGVDTRENINAPRDWKTLRGGQADTIYLLSYDRKEELLRVIVLPRDTMTPVMVTDLEGEVVTEETMQLCLQYGYGDGRRKSCEMMCDAVSYLFYDLPLHSYAAINLDTLPVLADLLGGVEVTLPDDSMADVNPEWTEGTTVILDRDNAEAFLRYRDKEADLSAWTRMNRQKVFVKAFAEQLQTMQKKDAGTVTRVYEGLKPYMITDMGTDVFLDLVQAKQEGDITTLPGEDVVTDNWDEFHVDQDELYKLILDSFYKETA